MPFELPVVGCFDEKFVQNVNLLDFKIDSTYQINVKIVKTEYNNNEGYLVSVIQNKEPYPIGWIPEHSTNLRAYLYSKMTHSVEILSTTEFVNDKFHDYHLHFYGRLTKRKHIKNYGIQWMIFEVDEVY